MFSKHKKNQLIRLRGFSLIELMIALTLGMLLTTALVTLFINISRTNNEMAKTNSQIENGRFAIQFLENDLVHAGFWGGYIPQFDDLTATAVPTDLPAAVPAPCLAYASWDADYKTALIGLPIDAYDGAPSSCSGIVTNQKANTDLLVVRHAETCPLVWNNATTSWAVPSGSNCDADMSGKLYFQYSLCETQISAGNRYVLGTSGFNLTKRNCSTSGSTAYDGYADKRRFISNIYYIRDWAVTAPSGPNPGDGIPTLVRSQFDESSGTLAHQNAVALIEGIEAFRIELGIDNVSDSGAAVNYAQAVTWATPTNLVSPTNRGDGSVDGNYIHCGSSGCSRDQLVNAVVAKLYVLARADKQTPGYTDDKIYTLGNGQTYCRTTSSASSSACAYKVLNPNYKHHVFISTVRLNNISMRRETP